MKLGFVSAILEEYTFEQVIDFASENGFACVELACWPQEKASRRYAGVCHLNIDNLDDRKAAYVKKYCADRIYASSELLEEKSRFYATLPAGHSLEWADAFRNGICDFYTYLGKEKPDYGYADLIDEWRIMEIVEACLISNREKRWMEVGTALK